MVRFFVPLWSESSLQKAFPTENFSKSKKQLSTFHLMIWLCNNRALKSIDLGTKKSWALKSIDLGT
jgi:hypothetical protein